MRSVLMFAAINVDLMSELSALPGWHLRPLGIPGGFDHCLANGGERIALHVIAPNVIRTANVLPHDWNHDKARGNALLKKLSLDLHEAGIDNVVSAFMRDLA